MMYVDSIPNLILTKKSLNWKKLSYLNEVVELSKSLNWVATSQSDNVLCAVHCFYFDLKVGRELQ